MVRLDAPLSKRVQGACKVTAAEASERTKFRPSRSTVTAVGRRIDRHAAARLATEARDRFFEHTLAAGWGAVAHFRCLLDDAVTENAILVDRFFGTKSLLKTSWPTAIPCHSFASRQFLLA
jgi:hypothetical protein